MHDTTAITAAQTAVPPQALSAYRRGPRYAEFHRHYPSVAYLRRRARHHIPHFAFEYADGGSGKDDAGIRRNWAAFDAVELVPRYGVMPSLPSCEVELFGRRYNAPIGVAPMGGPSIIWPGGDLHLARAAQRAGIPYALSTAGGATIEEVARVAPDVFWFQLYRLPADDHAVSRDLVDRAEAAGCRTLVLTLDVPVRTTRPRETATGMSGTFNVDLTILWQIMRAPGWAAAIVKHGMPRFASLRSYAGSDPSLNDVIAFARREIRGAFTWDEVRQYRDRWKGTLIVKGILHPQDAETAVSLGIDGIIVSNHGGRQNEALPAAIDALPAIARHVGARATVLMDSGVRSGSDVARACALGASAAFVGKAFLWGLGALGEDGPGYVADLLIEETQAALGQWGVHSIEAARTLTVRHPGALRF
jgi:(S)-mandelate dehydrogenase